jgi:hypothetical protein
VKSLTAAKLRPEESRKSRNRVCAGGGECLPGTYILLHLAGATAPASCRRRSAVLHNACCTDTATRGRVPTIVTKFPGRSGRGTGTRNGVRCSAKAWNEGGILRYNVPIGHGVEFQKHLGRRPRNDEKEQLGACPETEELSY